MENYAEIIMDESGCPIGIACRETKDENMRIDSTVDHNEQPHSGQNWQD